MLTVKKEYRAKPVKRLRQFEKEPTLCFHHLRKLTNR